MYDYSRLRGRMTEKGYTIASLAEKIGIQPRTLSSRLDNKSEFKMSEVDTMVNILEIHPDEVSSYFFTRKVQFN